MAQKKRQTAAREKPTAAKSPPGRPEHQPDANTRRLVRSLAFEGVVQRRIAMHLEVDEKTLVKYYRNEIDLSSEKLCPAVAQILARIVLRENGGQASVNAGKFILSYKAGWREAHRIETADQ
jgi:hypothetical protein